MNKNITNKDKKSTCNNDNNRTAARTKINTTTEAMTKITIIITRTTR